MEGISRRLLFGVAVLLVAACGESTGPSAGLVFAAVSAGDGHTCGLTTSGAAYCWGRNYSGELGTGSADTNPHTTPLPVVGGLTFAPLSAGGGATCGVTASGAVYCWGNNGLGQLGIGTVDTIPRTMPTLIAGGLHFASVSAGDYGDACGVTTSGAAYCWGANFYGELGTGSLTSSPSPVAVAGGLNFSGVSAGFYHTCGVTTGGAAHCWGSNVGGELGNTSWANALTPTPVVGGLSFSAISASRYHTCGVTTSGAAYCWGTDNPEDFLPTPVAVPGGLHFAAVSAGPSHTCGVTTSGAAYCWGDNFYGELGDGSRRNSGTPVAVAGGLAFAAVSAGPVYSCGVTRSGTAYCWGLNISGQLGNGTIVDSPTPVRVAGQP